MVWIAGASRYGAEGVPSLIDCELLKVTGKVQFATGVVCRGKVEIVNGSAETKTVTSGLYDNQVCHL